MWKQLKNVDIPLTRLTTVVCLHGGSLSGDAFSNLALVYSSLVLFSTKPEDLYVKVGRKNADLYEMMLTGCSSWLQRKWAAC